MISSDSGDALEKVIKGVSDSIIGKGEKLIKEFVKRFKNRNVRFIEDISTIDSVLKEEKSSEIPIYKSYLNLKPKSDLYYQILMGLTLRSLEGNYNSKKVIQLRNKILLKYGVRGLYISQLVQCGALKTLINYMNTTMDLDSIDSKLNIFLENVDKNVYFVKAEETPEEILDSLKIKLVANSPEFFIFAGFSTAMNNVKEVYSKLENEEIKEIKGYELSGLFNKINLVGFLIKKFE